MQVTSVRIKIGITNENHFVQCLLLYKVVGNLKSLRLALKLGEGLFSLELGMSPPRSALWYFQPGSELH